MAVTEVRLEPAHLDACLALSAAAGWNQNAADWRLMLELGTGWGVALPDGTLAASTLVIPYGAFAWISMVLVLPAQRRRGLATRLLRTALAYLHHRGLTPILDATPAGREVYRQEGFRDLWGFKRFIVPRRRAASAQRRVRPLREEDWSWIIELDRAAFGADRERLLRALAGRLPAAALVVEGEGFVLGREGRELPQLGPLVAVTAEGAEALVRGAISRIDAPLYADMADHARLETSAFALQRPFTRMAYGAVRAPGDGRKVCLVAGPELG